MIKHDNPPSENKTHPIIRSALKNSPSSAENRRNGGNMKSSSLKESFFGFACRKRIFREFFSAASPPMNIHQAGVLADRFMFSSVNHALEKRVKLPVPDQSGLLIKKKRSGRSGIEKNKNFYNSFSSDLFFGKSLCELRQSEISGSGSNPICAADRQLQNSSKKDLTSCYYLTCCCSFVCFCLFSTRKVVYASYRMSNGSLQMEF